MCFAHTTRSDVQRQFTEWEIALHQPGDALCGERTDGTCSDGAHTVILPLIALALLLSFLAVATWLWLTKHVLWHAVRQHLGDSRVQQRGVARSWFTQLRLSLRTLCTATPVLV